MESVLNISNILNYNDKDIFMITDQDNEFWFKAKDVAELLEYKNSRDAIIKHVDDEYKINYNDFSVVVKRGYQNLDKKTVFINELGLYSLIMKSKLPQTKEFQKWVYNVIKTIRKTGEYKLKQQLHDKDYEIESLKRSNRIMFNTAREIINEQEEKIEKIKPDIVPKTENLKLRPCFILVKLNDEEYEYTYYVIRCQEKNLNRAIDNIFLKHQDCEELLSFYDPNAVNLYSRIKENLKNYLEFHGNYFRIKNKEFSEEELIKNIEDLHSEREI